MKITAMEKQLIIKRRKVVAEKPSWFQVEGYDAVTSFMNKYKGKEVQINVMYKPEGFNGNILKGTLKYMRDSIAVIDSGHSIFALEKIKNNLKKLSSDYSETHIAFYWKAPELLITIYVKE
jgi:hypothetical protein